MKPPPGQPAHGSFRIAANLRFSPRRCSSGRSRIPNSRGRTSARSGPGAASPERNNLWNCHPFSYPSSSDSEPSLGMRMADRPGNTGTARGRKPRDHFSFPALRWPLTPRRRELGLWPLAWTACSRSECTASSPVASCPASPPGWPNPAAGGSCSARFLRSRRPRGPRVLVRPQRFPRAAAGHSPCRSIGPPWRRACRHGSFTLAKTARAAARSRSEHALHPGIGLHRSRGAHGG